MKRTLSDDDTPSEPKRTERPRGHNFRSPFPIHPRGDPTQTDPCNDVHPPYQVSLGDVCVTSSSLACIILDYDASSDHFLIALVGQPSDVSAPVESAVSRLPAGDIRRVCDATRLNYVEARELQRLLLVFFGLPPNAGESLTDSVLRVRSELTRRHPGKPQVWVRDDELV